MADQDDKSLDNDYKDVFTEKAFSSRDVEDVLSDINDGDDDAGIFATSPHRVPYSKGASAALLGTVVLLAVVAVGAYFAVTSNQDSLDQIKQNLDMTVDLAGESIASPPEELAGVVAPDSQGNAETSVGSNIHPPAEEVPQPDVVANVLDQSVPEFPAVSAPAPGDKLVSPPTTEGGEDSAALGIVDPKKLPETAAANVETVPSPAGSDAVKPSTSKAETPAKLGPISPTEGEEAKKGIEIPPAKKEEDNLTHRKKKS